MLRRNTNGLAFSLCLLATAAARADDWPQWGGPLRDGVWRETGIVEKFDPGILSPMWTVKIGDGYAGPAVADGKVFVTDLVDRRGREGTERVLCIDAESYTILWTHKYPVRYDIAYDNGPRATPVIDGTRVYTIGAVGNLFCLNVADGSVVWQTDFQNDFNTQLPQWGMAASPLVDGDQLIALVGGAGKATVVSFDKLTGKTLWKAIDDPEVGYCPPMIYTFGKTRQLIVWHPSAVSALDPPTGKTLWNVPFRIKAGLTIPTPKQVGNRLFVTAFYEGPMMLDVSPDRPAAKIVWKGKGTSEQRTDGLHSIMSTPIVTETHIYGVCSYGQLRCLDARTGKRIWETLEATGDGRWWNAFLVPQGDRVFLHNEQGDLIIAKLSPAGYKEICRAKLIEPTRPINQRMTIWSHPAFAMKSVFARNDGQLVRVNLAAE